MYMYSTDIFDITFCWYLSQKCTKIFISILYLDYVLFIWRKLDGCIYMRLSYCKANENKVSYNKKNYNQKSHFQEIIINSHR